MAEKPKTGEWGTSQSTPDPAHGPWDWSHPYWGASAFVAIATLVRLLLDPLFEDQFPFLTYFAAIAAAGVVGGWRASAFAVGLSYVVAAWFFLPPRHAIGFPNGWPDYLALIAFLLVGAVISWLTHLLHSSRDSEKDQRRRVDEILKSIADGFAVLDRDYRIVFVNREAERIIGKSATELIGRNHWEEFPESRGTELETQYRKAMEERVPISLEYFYPAWNKWFHISASPSQEGGITLAFHEITERKLASNRIYEQREWLRVTLDSIGEAVIATDRDAKIVFMNRVAEGLTGWRMTEAQSRPLDEIFRIINERTREIAVDPCQRVLETGRTVGLANHTVLIARNGIERPIDDSAAPIRDADGKIIGVILVFRDATEERRAQESAERLGAIVAHSEDAIIGESLEGVITSWNRAAERMYGYSAEEIIGQPMTKIVPDDKREQLHDILARLHRGERITNLETVRLRKDGTRLTVSITLSPIKNAYGEIIGASKIARDITELKQKELELAQSEERFRMAAAAVAGIIYDADYTSGVVHRTQGLYEVLGYLPDEVPSTAQWWHDQMHPDDRERIKAESEALHDSTATHLHFEYRVRHRDGHWVYLMDRSLLTRDADGRPVRQIGCSVDITLSRLAEQALIEAARRKDEFLATLAHELRNPLAPIRNAVELLRMDGLPSEIYGDTINIIDRQGQHLTRLVDDLLDVSRITRGKLQLRKERVSLRSVVQSAVEAAMPQLDGADHELTVTLPDREVFLEADPTRLDQVLANLLQNAAKYTPRGGHVWLTCTSEDGQLAISVRDTGIGIPADHLKSIFEMFSQVAPALERSQGGLGIGLSLVKGLVELHGGTIEARSAGLNLGSEFLVQLPVSPETAPEASNGEDANRHATGGQRRRVLVVDDNLDLANTTSRMLKILGHEVETAYDGLEAVNAAAAFRPDVVLLDIGLPRMNGYEVAAQIRQQSWGKDMVLIAQTGWGQQEDKQRAAEAGFDHHLTKPVDSAQLLKLIAQVRPGREEALAGE